MGERLSGEDFENLFRYYRSTAFRLEVQPIYTVEAEQQSLADFLAGRPQNPPDIPYLAAWFGQIRDVTSAGRRVERVRITDHPPTDYQRWERWIGQWNEEAGEVIHYLPRPIAVDAGIPVDHDWWLFDGERLAVMKFDEIGRPLGGEIVIDPGIVIQHVAWRDLAVQLSAREGSAT